MLVPDSRLPVGFGTMADAGPEIALIIEGDAPAPAGIACARFIVRPVIGHSVGCACCAPRSSAAEALSRLFLARARGQTVLFQAVVAITSSEAGRRAVLAALAADPLAVARFRLGLQAEDDATTRENVTAPPYR